jgi:hypothetical protein
VIPLEVVIKPLSVGTMTDVLVERTETSWGRRIIILVVAAMGGTFLAIALSAALARPASAATLPVPGIPTLPGPVGLPLVNGLPGTVSGAVGDATATPSAAVTGTPTALTGVVPTEPLGTLPGHLPIVNLPIPQVPLSIAPATRALTTGVAPAGTGTTSDGPAPGIGGSAHGSAGRSSSTVRNTGSRFHRSDGRGSSGSDTSGNPQKVPSHQSPSPSFPLVPSGTGEASSPGHWGGSGSALPLAILLLGALGLGGVLLRRRLFPRLLADARFAPPG